MSAKKKPQAKAATKKAKSPVKQAKPPKEKRGKGRPTLYSKAIADEIIERLSVGEPLAQICRDDHMPSKTTVWEWGQKSPQFSERVTRARDDGFDALAQDCLNIADDNSRDRRMIVKNGQAVEIVDNDVIQRAKLRVETRLKLLACWDPKRYGPKVDVNNHHSGEIIVEIGGNAE